MSAKITIRRHHKQLPQEQSQLENADTAAIEEVFSKEDLRAIKRLARDYEKTFDYYYLRNRPWRMIWTGFISGMARGLGIAVGITVLAFLLLTILRRLEVLDLPFLGNFIADLLEYIDNVRRGGIY